MAEGEHLARNEDRASGRAAGALSRYAFVGGFVVAAFVTALGVFLTATEPGATPGAQTSQLVLDVLSLNLALILCLSAAAAWRARNLFGRGGEDAGVRLHRRFVVLFALAAVLPAIVVALFFGLLVNRGVETWFSSRVRTVVDNAATVARSYMAEQEHPVRDDVILMARDLNRPGIAALLATRRLTFDALLQQAVVRDFSSVYVIDGEGRVLAQAEAPNAPPYAVPPPATLARAAALGEIEGSEPERGANVFRAVYRLRGYPDAFLYVNRSINPTIVGQLRASEAAVVAYRAADRGRARIQAIFALSYLSTALLVLVGAVWLGVSAATQISTPVSRLVVAADRVAGGDLDARVDVDHDPEEIAVLSRAFNRMTSDLQSQQRALKAASEEALERRRFIEAVLSGVSAGVIGLDPDGRVSAVNDQALSLLGLSAHAPLGRGLSEVSPELAEVADAARGAGGDAEAEIDLMRDAQTYRLRVRASGRADGLVLTFDDITRLVTAQRSAAWRDVARRIAHEIKNPLTPIQLSAERIRRKYRRDITHDVETFDRCTETIVRQVGDIGRMVDEFSAFARMPSPKFASEDAAELLRQAVFAQRVSDPDVEVELAGPATAPGLVCDSRMVGQALANLLKNAGEGVEARRVADPNHAGRILARLVADERGFRFEIEDNGIGLPKRDRERLTEPYVTTREKGTGLGLAIVKRIMEEHGGELTLGDAQVADGALAVLRFPIRQRMSTSPAYAGGAIA